MASEKKRTKRLNKQRQAAREAHERLLEKVARSRAKFEKRMQQLHTLEAEIAGLEQESYDPDAARLGQAPGKETLRDALLIYNTKAAATGKADFQIDKLVELLRAHGIRAEVGIKTSGKAARAMAKEAAQNGRELVIVAGGDGTIEEIAAQLVGTATTLAILPVGTRNNIARSLGIPLDLNDASALIGMGVTRKIDIGRVLAGESKDIEYFMETAGLGLSAIAVPAGQDVAKGYWSALPKALRQLFELKPSPIAIELDDGGMLQAHTQMVTVSNAPLIGTNILIAPDAKMDDGLLDIAVYDEMTKSELVGYLMSANNGKPASDARVKRYRARHVRIHAGHATPVASDKDEVPERREMEITIVPGGLTMIVGNGGALSLPVQAVPAASGSENELPDTTAQPVVVGEIVPGKNNGAPVSEPTK
jgi:YegS/Rv2252/BmrU family lipid kinase